VLSLSAKEMNSTSGLLEQGLKQTLKNDVETKI
jgi:hypothetical protein